ncbi:MAG: OmpA family protein, partial [Polaribacter sp.]
VIDSADNCPTIAGVPSNGGCPAKVVTNNNNNSGGGSSFLSMTRKIQFNTAKYSFTNEAYVALEAIVNYMKQNSGAIYRIQGHADSVGTSSNNRALSVKRAQAVKKYLVDHGISSEIITTEGFGEANPLELNSTSGGRAANRRIEIIEIR